jgi:hypothetical protein
MVIWVNRCSLTYGENDIGNILAILSAEYEGIGDAAEKDLLKYLDDLRQLNLLEG